MSIQCTAGNTVMCPALSKAYRHRLSLDKRFILRVPTYVLQ